MLPTIIIGEDHSNDFQSKFLMKHLDKLTGYGYKVFAFEEAMNTTLDDLINEYAESIKETDQLKLSLKLSSLQNLTPEEKKELDFYINNHSAEIAFLELLKGLKSKGWKYMGIDENLPEERNNSFLASNALTPEIREKRDNTMVKNLLNNKSKFGTIVVIGFSHMENIQKKLIDKLGKEKACSQFICICTGSQRNPMLEQAIARIENNVTIKEIFYPIGINFLRDEKKLLEFLQEKLKYNSLKSLALNNFFDSTKNQKNPLDEDGEPTTRFGFYKS